MRRASKDPGDFAGAGCTEESPSPGRKKQNKAKQNKTAGHYRRTAKMSGTSVYRNYGRAPAHDSSQYHNVEPAPSHSKRIAHRPLTAARTTSAHCSAAALQFSGPSSGNRSKKRCTETSSDLASAPQPAASEQVAIRCIVQGATVATLCHNITNPKVGALAKQKSQCRATESSTAA